MKRILLGLITWLLATSVALASVNITETAGSILSANGTATSFTFSSVGTGTAAADRITAVTVQNADLGGTGEFITSITVGGNATTCVANVNDGANFLEQETCWVINPTGTTATVVVNVSTGANLHSVLIDVFSVTGADTTTPVSSSSTGTNSSDPSASITITSTGNMLGSSSTVPSASVTPLWGDAAQSQHLCVAITLHECLGTSLSFSTGAITVDANWGTPSVTTALISLVAFQQSGAGPRTITRRSLTGVGN